MPTMVERVSNADRARYALRASPNARQQKTRRLQSLFGKRQLSSTTARVTFLAEATRSTKIVDAEHRMTRSDGPQLLNLPRAYHRG